jgi:AraC family transcriptional regulator
MTEDDGVLVTSANVNGFDLVELRFPAGYVQRPFEPESPYLAVVLEGGLEKAFRLRTIHLAEASVVCMPTGATHGARFGSDGARVLVIRPMPEWDAPRGCLDRLVELRGRGFGWLAWRLAGELRASDAAAPLAAEGFALELLAAASRASTGDRPRRAAAWLAAAEELLRVRLPDRIGLGELADAVAVHPAHLARVFRARHGVSVGEYARRLRLEWAAAQVARTDTPLALVARQAGFADQSHFTRVFQQRIGTTPARFRADAHGRRGNAPEGPPSSSR